MRKETHLRFPASVIKEVIQELVPPTEPVLKIDRSYMNQKMWFLRVACVVRCVMDVV